MGPQPERLESQKAQSAVRAQGEFKVSLLASRVATNAFGELIVLNTIGRSLFDSFSPTENCCGVSVNA